MDIISLTKAFSGYKFTETTHEYTHSGQKVEISVTTLLGRLSEPFNEAKWLPIKAKQLGRTEADLKAEWTRKANLSTAKGTAIHRYMENAMNGKLYKETFPEAMEFDLVDEVAAAYYKILPLCDKFISDSECKLIPIKTEFTVGIGTKLAGQIDLLVWNEVAKEYQIIDYKTNKEIKQGGGFSNFLPPIQHLNNNELVHYSLQLGTYKEILRRHGFEVGGLYLIWLNENNAAYHGFRCQDLEDDCRKIIDKEE